MSCTAHTSGIGRRRGSGRSTHPPNSPTHPPAPLQRHTNQVSISAAAVAGAAAAAAAAAPVRDSGCRGGWGGGGKGSGSGWAG